MHRLLVIGLSGKAGVGKDFIAKHILKPLFDNALIVAFADFLKLDCIVKLNVPYDDVYKHKTKESRKCLQEYGTENGRNKYGLDIWCKYMSNFITIMSERNNIKVFIIPDVRFVNEVDLIEKDYNGFVIRVVAPQRNEHRIKLEHQNYDETSHISETELDNYSFKYVVYNDVKDHNYIHKQVHHIMSEEQIIPKKEH